MTSNLAPAFDSLHYCPGTGKYAARTMRQTQRKSDAFIKKFAVRLQFGPSLLIFCAQAISALYFSRIQTSRPPRKSLIPEILQFRSGFFFAPDICNDPAELSHIAVPSSRFISPGDPQVERTSRGASRSKSRPVSAKAQRQRQRRDTRSERSHCSVWLDDPDPEPPLML